MVRRRGLPLAGAVLAAAVVVAGAGAIVQPPAHHAPDLSSSVGVAKYLKSLGLDPKGFVIQRGQHNYAGKSCPGVGWTCTTAKHVVQIMYPTNNPGNTNQFTCSGSGGTATSPDNNTCTIVQASAGTDNNATCVEKIGDPTGTQSCQIYQLNTTGANNAYVQQQIAAAAAPLNAQSATQDTQVAQWAGSGSNNVQVNQDIKESQSAVVPKGGSIAQTQDGHQTTAVSQHSDTGNNTAKVLQSLALKESATGGTSITQNQDSTPGSPNTSAAIYQNSDQDPPATITSSGANNAYLFQSNDLNASGSKTGTLTQTQGSASSGIFGHTDQQSLGVSSGLVNQNEHQNLGESQVGTLSQHQFGPEWYDPNQGGNAGDRLNVSQSSDQNADPSATQIDEEDAACSSSGVCAITEKASNDKTNVNNSCTSTPTSPCDISVTLVSPCGVECPPPTCSGDCTSVPFDTPPPVNICTQIASAPPCAPPPPVSTTTGLASSVNPSGCAQGTMLTATVSPSTATGSVQFSFGANPPFATVPLSGGSASTTVSSPQTGMYTATYVPTGNYTGSSGTVSQTVNCIP
jgi:hypothetical protein